MLVVRALAPNLQQSLTSDMLAIHSRQRQDLTVPLTSSINHSLTRSPVNQEYINLIVSIINTGYATDFKCHLWRPNVAKFSFVYRNQLFYIILLTIFAVFLAAIVTKVRLLAIMAPV